MGLNSISAFEDTNQRAGELLAKWNSVMAPLGNAQRLAWYNAFTEGTEDATGRSRQADDELDRVFSNQEVFQAVDRLLHDPNLTEPLAKRQCEILHCSMLGKQIAQARLEAINAQAKRIERQFNTFRGTVDGLELSSNQIGQILATSGDPAELKTAWEAQKSVGALVRSELAELVHKRNEVAHQLGIRDYFALRMKELEQDEGELVRMFDELDSLTKGPFLQLKGEVDRRLAHRLSIPTNELMPWHYQNPFFQSPPKVFDSGLDRLYETVDILDVARKFYSGIGLDVSDILARSDLYERPGKTQHAFAFDIDRAGDVRIIVNIVPSLYWQSTVLHELAHALNFGNVSRELPWILREATHTYTSEGIALMFEGLVYNPAWATEMGIVDREITPMMLAESRTQRAFELLQFSRFTQVMFRFERAMYANPDHDLNRTWWDLVEEYQALRRPPGRDGSEYADYASKIHIATLPVYYHNFMLGQLFAAQLHEAIASLIGAQPNEVTFVARREIGEFLLSKVFAPGRSVRHDIFVEDATGAKLSVNAFVHRLQGLCS